MECELDATIQITKITRPLRSVSQMTKSGEIMVVCKKNEAVVNLQHEVLIVLKQKGGFYVADIKVRNPRFKQPFGGPAR